MQIRLEIHEENTSRDALQNKFYQSKRKHVKSRTSVRKKSRKEENRYNKNNVYIYIINKVRR